MFKDFWRIRHPAEFMRDITRRISLKPSFSERVDTLRSYTPVIGKAITYALEKDNPSVAFMLLDSAKSLVSRDLLFRRKFEALLGTGTVLSMAHGLEPEGITRLLNSEPDLCIVSLYQSADRTFYAFLVFSESGKHHIAQIPLATGSAGTDLFEQLSTLKSSPLWRDEDETFRILSSILGEFGERIMPTLLKMTPRRVVLIPHKLLHLIPLHLMYCVKPVSMENWEAPWENIYLEDLAKQLIYCSSVSHYMYRGKASPLEASQPSEPKADPKAFLACVDTDALYAGATLERERYEAITADLGANSARVVTTGNLQSEVPGFLVVALACHARSDPLDWRRSCILFSGRETFAEEIAFQWNLSAAVLALLSACETGTDRSVSEAIDEYLGLDAAVNISGARSVLSTMWPVHDTTAALFGMFVIEEVFRGVQPSIALRRARQLLRSGMWKGSLEAGYIALERAKGIDARRREINLQLIERLLTLDFEQFTSERHWGCFRCYGGW